MGKEQWKQIKIKEFRGKYKIGQSGRIKKTGRYSKSLGNWIKEKFVPLPVTKKGYARVALRKNGYSKSYYVHRLVALTFVPNPHNKPCVNHKDGNKLNNHYSNLEWCTNEENNAHAKAMGLFCGSNSKIPKNQRKFIKENFFVIGRAKLAEMFGLTEEYILSVAKVKVNGTNQRKKPNHKSKEIINIVTGESTTSKKLALIWQTSPRYVNRIISEERKPNTTEYRYSGRYI